MCVQAWAFDTKHVQIRVVEIKHDLRNESQMYTDGACKPQYSYQNRDRLDAVFSHRFSATAELLTLDRRFLLYSVSPTQAIYRT